MNILWEPANRLQLQDDRLATAVTVTAYLKEFSHFSFFFALPSQSVRK